MNPIQLDFRVPPLVPDAPAIEAVIRTLESLWPASTLTFQAEMSTTAGVRLMHLPDRARWIEDRLRSGAHAQVFSGLEQPPINVTFHPAGQAARDGTSASRVTVWLPQDALQGGRLRQILGQLGDAASAWHGAFMPIASGSLIMQIISLPSPPHEPAASLLEAIPALSELRKHNLYVAPATARVPSIIGWLNYWSEATATLLHFLPDHALGGAERTSAGAWSWQLTTDLFDVRSRDDAAALLEAYRRLSAAVPPSSG